MDVSSNVLNGVKLGKGSSSSGGVRKPGRRTSAKKKALKARIRQKLANGGTLTKREVKFAVRKGIFPTNS
jgi:hypothetical protein